ncbi:MAG: UDP-glucose 4-epimerase GalE [bacterium]
MRVFVTGGAGYIGSVCVEELLKAGHEVSIFDNLSEGHRSAVEERAEFIQGDLADRENIKATLQRVKPEAVIHFAGRALVPESMRDPSLYYRVNIGCGVNLLDAMVEAGCKKIIFSSSCATYGVPDKVPIDERTPQRPVNPYGHSKLVFEQILKWYEKIHGVVFTALRYFNAAGASEKWGEHHRVETHLIPNVLKVALGHAEKVPVYGNNYPTPDGTCIRDYIHVTDLASAHILAIKRNASGAYNLGTGNGYSVLQVVDAARRVTGHPIPIEILPPREGDPPSLVAAANKLKYDFNWEPKFTKIVDIVDSAWKWHHTHPNGYPD